jgi:tetratricopeptide (TPR) repeat protein
LKPTNHSPTTILVSIYLFVALCVPGSLSSAPSRGVTLISEHGERIGGYGGSYALLISNSVYSQGWSTLESVPTEMDSVQKALESQGFKVTRFTDLNSEDLADAYEDFVERYGYDSNNRLVLFFSGHGFSRNNGTKGYLVPTDAPNPAADEKGFLRSALPMSRLLSLAREMEAKHGLFLFDSCFSGSIFKSRSLPTRARYISRITAEPVRQFITSGSAGEEVPANSVFTPAFVDAIEHGLADLNQDGYITGTELGLFLQETVTQFLPQTPQFGKINDYDLSRGDFVFKVDERQSSTTKDLRAFLSELQSKSKAEPIEAKRPEDVKKSREMEQNFRDIEGLVLGDALSLEDKHAAWSYFLSIYSEDLIGIDIDDKLRSLANDKIATIERDQSDLKNMKLALEQLSQNNAPAEEQLSLLNSLSATFGVEIQGTSEDERYRKELAGIRDQLVDTANWEKSQAAMQAEFDKLSTESSSLLNQPTLGVAAWSNFLSSHSANNPYSLNDDFMREVADKQRSEFEGLAREQSSIKKMLDQFASANSISDNDAKKKIRAFKKFNRRFEKSDEQDATSLVAQASAEISRLEALVESNDYLFQMTKAFKKSVAEAEQEALSDFLERYDNDLPNSREDNLLRQRAKRELALLVSQAEADAFIAEMETAFSELDKTDKSSLLTFLDTWNNDVDDNERDDQIRQQAINLVASIEKNASSELKLASKTTLLSNLELVVIANQLKTERLRFPRFIHESDDSNLIEGVQLFSDKDFSGATKALSQSINRKLTKQNILLRGAAYQMMGYYDEAIRDYSRGIKAFKDSSFFYNRAVIYIEQGDIEAAIADLSQAIDSYPDFRTLNNRGVAFALAGEFESARKDLTTALELNNKSSNALNNRGLIHEIIGKDDLARNDYEEAVRLRPGFREARRNLDLLNLRTESI